MYSLPTTIKIRDNEFKIRENGDFRMVLDCFSALQDSELSKEERVISSLIIFYENLNGLDDVNELFNDEEATTEAIEKMFNFFNCNEPSIGLKQQYKLIDWEQDSQLICSAINNVAKIEIRSMPYCHWWTFMGYYISIGDSVLATVVNIRHKSATHKKLENYEKDFKKDNPQYFSFDYRTEEQKEEDERIRAMFDGGNVSG